MSSVPLDHYKAQELTEIKIPEAYATEMNKITNMVLPFEKSI